MRFQRIHIDGFGRLVNLDLTLTPGLNIFFGPNEVGKSTLQHAIFVLLYGFYGGNRKTPKETEFLEQFRPWSGEAYGGQLLYTLDNGKTYHLDFAQINRQINNND